MINKNLKKGGGLNVDELFTINEVIEKLKISRTKLGYLMKAGAIPYVKVGESPRFVGSEVMKALRNITKQETAAVRSAR